MQSFEHKIERAKSLLKAFCLAEYESDAVDFSDLSGIPIAYTTTEDEQHEIQVYVDLIGARIITMVDANQVDVEAYASIDEMISDVLPYLDFDDLVSIDEEELQSLEQKIQTATEKCSTEQDTDHNKQQNALDRG